MSAQRRFRFTPLAALLLAIMTSAPAAFADTPDPDFIRAAGHGDLAAVSTMLKDGADANYRDHSGVTALMAAASAGHVEVIQALVAAGADANKRPTGGWTALLHAVIGDRLEVVKVLLAARADPDICASSYAQCRGPLMTALANGNLKMSLVLLEGGASVNTTTSYGATPLRFAVWGDGPERIAMVKALLARGADVDAGYPPRYKIPDIPVAKVTVDGTAEVNITGIAMGRSAEGTALGDMAGNRSAEFVKVLLDAGAKVDARQPGRRTPLMIASIGGNLPVVRLLLDAGADVNAKDSNDRTALDLALANRRQDVATLLRNAATVRTPQ